MDRDWNVWLNAPLSFLVQRGRDWKWGDQDGGEGKLGKVVKGSSTDAKEGWANVKWDQSGSTNAYRIGDSSSYDLKVGKSNRRGLSYLDVIGGQLQRVWILSPPPQIVFQCKCANGHSMDKVKGSTRSSATCDICYKSMKERSPGDTIMSHCSTCDFDVCSVCMSGAHDVPVTEGSYVTVSPGYKDVEDAGGGPLVPGSYGVVTKTDSSSLPYKVCEI